MRRYHDVRLPVLIDLLQHQLQTPYRKERKHTVIIIARRNIACCPRRTAWTRSEPRPSLHVVHLIGGLVVRVDGVFVADLPCPIPLLVHVGAPHQLSAKVPSLAPRQLHVHDDVVVGFLDAESQT